MARDSSYWIDQYQRKNALWIHDGNPKRPHALLTSGKHSNGFFNSGLVIPDEVLLQEATSDLLEIFGQCGGEISKVQAVVGPQTGATKLAELMSKHVAARTGRECFWASPAKSDQAGERSMVFSDDDLDLLFHRSVLLGEDVLSTGSSVDLTARAVIEARGFAQAFVLVLVNRSGLTEVSGRKIVALIDRPMLMWTKEECPLCPASSEAIPAKDNWARLNAPY
ncbi:hypothetical protein H0X32_01845 [Patescibacteria group bacterium]|nr:hypothetical protein [Patescibacteria group bacterium]